MAGSLRSPLLPLGIAAPASKAGFRSAGGIWFGGASAPSGVTQAGFRDLCGLWFGGASANPIVPPVPNEGVSATPFVSGWKKQKRLDDLEFARLLARDEEEIVEILLLITPLL